MRGKITVLIIFVMIVVGLLFFSRSCSKDNIDGNKVIADEEYNDCLNITYAKSDLGEVIQIVAGSRRTCALFDSGNVACWGDGYMGECNVPSYIDGITNAEKIVMDRGKACAILERGVVKCWVSNKGTNIRELSQEGFVIDMAADNSACMIYSDGKVYCDGSEKPMDNINNASKIVDGNIVCVIDNNKLKCWGKEINGMISGEFQSEKTFKTPTEVESINNIKDISMGNRLICAIITDELDRDQWMCWGSFQGLSSSVPVKIKTELPPGSTSSPVSISSYDFNACAVFSDGRILCFGDDRYGQIGNGNKTGSVSRALFVSNITDAKQVSVGKDHTCALLNNGEVYCWGRNEKGQLGDGTTNDRDAPVKVISLG